MSDAQETPDAFDLVYEAYEHGHQIISGLPERVEAGSHSAVFARDEHILNLTLDWTGQGDFTYSIDETFFDAPYRGWGHWSNGELLVTWTGGHTFGDGGHTATIIDGIDDEDEGGPEKPDWWHRLFLRVMDAMESPSAERTIGHDGPG